MDGQELKIIYPNMNNTKVASSYKVLGKNNHYTVEYPSSHPLSYLFCTLCCCNALWLLTDIGNKAWTVCQSLPGPPEYSSVFPPFLYYQMVSQGPVGAYTSHHMEKGRKWCLNSLPIYLRLHILTQKNTKKEAQSKLI